MEKLASHQQPEGEQQTPDVQALSALQQEVEVTLANPQDPEQPTHQCKTWEEYRTFKAQYERDMKRYEQKKRMYENQSIYGLDEAVKHDLAKYKVSKQRLFEFAQANDIENIRIEESEKISIKVGNIQVMEGQNDKSDYSHLDSRDIESYRERKIPELIAMEKKQLVELLPNGIKIIKPEYYNNFSGYSVGVLYADGIIPDYGRRWQRSFRRHYGLDENDGSRLSTKEYETYCKELEDVGIPRNKRFALKEVMKQMVESYITLQSRKQGVLYAYGYNKPSLPIKPLPPAPELTPIQLSNREKIRGYYQELPTKVVYNPGTDMYDITMAGRMVKFTKATDGPFSNLGRDILQLQEHYPSKINEYQNYTRDVKGKDLNEKMGRNVHSAFPDVHESFPSHQQLSSLELIGMSGINGSSPKHNGLVRLYRAMHKTSKKVGYIVVYEPHLDGDTQQPLSCFPLDASKLMTNEDKQSVELLGDIFIKQMLNNQPHTKVRQINTDYLPSQTSSGMQTVSSAQDKNISGLSLNKALDILLQSKFSVRLRQSVTTRGVTKTTSGF